MSLWNHKFDDCRRHRRQESLCGGLVALVGRWERCLKARNLSSRRDLSPLSLFGFPREPPPPPPSGMSLSPSPSVLLLHRLLLLHLLRYDRHHLLLLRCPNVPPRATMSSLSFYRVAYNPGSSHSISFTSLFLLVFPSFLPFRLSLALSLDSLLRFNGVHRGTRYICRCDSWLGVHMGKEEPAKLRGRV